MGVQNKTVKKQSELRDCDNLLLRTAVKPHLFQTVEACNCIPLYRAMKIRAFTLNIRDQIVSVPMKKFEIANKVEKKAWTGEFESFKKIVLQKSGGSQT